MARSSSALAVLLLVALVAFTARTWALSAERLQPKWDEVGYLALSRDYVREGGVVATVRCHVEGRCKESNRHPLFQLLLVPVVDDAPESFARAKLLTWATAIILVAAMAFFAWRAFDARVGVATGVLLALSPILADTSAEVRHDLLFTALGAAAIYAIGSGFGWKRWLLAGVFAGLAYLTKGSGHLVLAVAIGVALFHFRARIVRAPAAYAVMIGFVVGAWWLLFRNLSVFGSPFFNFNNRAAWLDQWSDIWELQRSPEWDRVGLVWFVGRHGWLGLVTRLVEGAGITFGLFVYAASVGFAGVAVQPDEVLANLPRLAAPIVTGVAVLALGGWGMMLRWREDEEHRSLIVATVLATLIFWAALSVGALGGHDNPRYLLLLTSCWIPFSAHALIHGLAPRLAEKLGRPRFGVERAITFVGVAALIAQLGWYRSGLGESPLAHQAVPPAWGKTSTWLSTRLRPGEKYALNYRSLYSTWDVPRPDSDPRWIHDFGRDPAVMMRLLDADRVNTILLDAQDQDFPYAKHEQKEHDGEGPLVFDGWPRCFADNGHPSRFLAFCRPETAS